MRPPLPAILILLCVLTAICHAADVRPDTYFVGVAEVEITPTDPIRLNGFGARREESAGVNHPIYARAISIRHADEKEPLVLMMVEVLGVTAEHRTELVKRLKGKVQPERLAVTATHTHCGPMVSGANPTIFGMPIPEDHLKHIDTYTKTYLDKLEQAATESLRDPKPAHLYWGVGSVGFAKNRRTPGGPTDHDLPVLVARDAKSGDVRAVYTTYACHCVTLTHNRISGDWAGYAATGVGKAFPGAVGLVSIGCGADQNPDAREPTDKDEGARVRGQMIVDEVKRLAGGYLAPVYGKPVCTLKSIELPLADHPDRKGWERLAEQKNAIGHHARVQLAKLDRGEKLMTAIDYPIQTWAFGDSLAMVHLPGEVVVDYSTRLKSELDRSRVWLTAYANNNPCYIPSERILKEGGYEGGGAMVYYDVPTPFKPGLEGPIVNEVKAQLGASFTVPFDPARVVGSKPQSPQQSLGTLRVVEPLAVDLVAAEPLVSDPIAIAFGPDGKLWVAEMLDYPSGRTGKFEPGGRVRYLEDTNGDGTFDTSTTFLDDLPFPTGVLPWRNGVLVCAAPDILYAEDADGDGKAEKVNRLFSGFGTDNYQARVNGLAYGLDGWVYGSCGLFGGTITCHKTGKQFALGNRDFRINPDTGEIEPAAGRTQQGRVRNDWDDWFGCDNSNLAWHYPLADDMVRRNPFVAPPNPTVNIALDNKLYPARPPQLFNLSGVGGRTTAACGIGVYRDSKLGKEFTGNTFTCEPVNLLVSRRVLKPSGTTFTTERAVAEAEGEFLAGTDPWFRPVMATTGPDGGLWVVDMYRYVIEHPRWIPPGELAKVDPRAGAGLGRIYRVRAKGESAKTWPRLDKMTTAELVSALDSPNGWQRDMATELLAWKGAKEAAEPLKNLATGSKRPEARLHAVITLDRLGECDAATVLTALGDPHPGVRRQAVRLGERFMNDNTEVAARIAKLVDDNDPQVRLQVAFALGEWTAPQAGGVLARLAAKDAKDPYLVAAVVSSLNKNTFAGSVTSPEMKELAASPLLPKLITTAVGLEDDKALSVLLAKVTTASGGKYAAWQYAAADSVLDAWQRAAKGKELPAEVVAMFAAARAVAIDSTAADELRTTAVRLLGRERAKVGDDIATLAGLLGAKTSPPVQSAVVAALARTADNAAADALMKGWGGYSPAVQRQVISGLLARSAWVPKVLAALEDGTLPPSAVLPGTRQALLTSPDTKMRALAEKAFAGAINADRAKVIATYTRDLPKAGDPDKGKAVFAKTCAACHKLGEVGQAVGPDLAALANKSAEYLLTEILDPSRNLDNRYLDYVVSTADGRTLNGLLATESSAAVTLRQADGKEVTILRADIDGFESSNRSFMPEGLEKDVPPPAMADLIAYLTSTEVPPKQLPGNKPAVVKVTNGRAVLPAAVAELRGGEITFETEFGNIGYWHGAKDHATWRLTLPAAGEFDVYIDFACDDASAGNPIALDGGEPTLRSKVIGTGGWAKYRLMRLGTIKLPAGDVKLVMRPDTDALKGSLIDLRTMLLVPKGQRPDTVTGK